MNPKDSYLSSPRRPAGRRIAALVVAAATIVALSACASDEPGTPTPSSASPSASSSPSPSATGDTPDADPGASAPPAGEATPIGIGCAQLITADDLYAYNPNLALVEEQPAAGSPAARAVAAGGIACHFLNLTSSETIVVSAANPGPTTLAQVRADLAATATPSDGLGGEGWFGGGTATVISGVYLVTATSDFFTGAADAQQLTTTAISHLG